MAQPVARPKVRSRRDGAAVPLDETDKRLLNLMQGSFALRPDPFAGVAEAAAGNGWLDERKMVLEVLTSIRRAGAELVVTYHAKDAADWLTG